LTLQRGDSTESEQACGNPLIHNCKDNDNDAALRAASTYTLHQPTKYVSPNPHNPLKRAIIHDQPNVALIVTSIKSNQTLSTKATDTP
jgi:hypothetical protein